MRGRRRIATLPHRRQKSLALSRHQRADMDRDAPGERVEIIAPFQAGDEPPAAIAVGKPDKLRRDPGEIAFVEAQIRQRVVAISGVSSGWRVVVLIGVSSGDASACPSDLSFGLGGEVSLGLFDDRVAELANAVDLDPDDVAELVSWLLDGKRSGFVTGANFVIDGGMTRKMIYEE